MQIHELTKGPRKPKQTNEGLLTSLKAAVSAGKTGYDAGKASGQSTGAALAQGAKNLGRAATDSAFGAQANWDKNASQANAKYDALKAKYGWKDKGDTDKAAAATGGPDIAKAAQDLTATFQQTDLFKDITGSTGQADQDTATAQDSETPFVEPGKQLTVPPAISGYPGSYTVDATGAWRSEDNKRITDQATIAKLNTFANQGTDTGKIKPTAVLTEPPQGKGKGGAAALNKAAGAAAATTSPASPMAEAASNARKARRAAAGITKPTTPPAAPATAPAPTDQPAQTTSATTTPAPGNQPGQTQAATPAADPSIVQKIEQDPKLKPLFAKFGKEFGVTPDEVKSRPEVKQALAGLLKVINSKAPAGKDQRVAKAFQSYATVVLTAMKAEGTGEDADGDGVPDAPSADQATTKTDPVAQSVAANKLAIQGLDKPTIDKFKKVAQQDPPTVKQALGLQERLNLELNRLKHTKLNEDQVRITKDIVVPTNAGNYVKKASDQEWYAPNGVMIDSEKYADYVKKLDSTPQAQTRYQADQASPSSAGGSDTSFKKAQQQPAPPPKAPINTNPPPATNPPPPGTPQPDPMAEMLKQQQIQQFLRNRDVSIINGLVKDTTEQLRNAEIFNTGQQDYLKQQLAQMIALKV